MAKITKAVLPAAGLGTRIMPLTLHQPKAMIGIVDRPIIHYVIKEVLATGIKHLIIVTSPEQKEFQKYIKYLASDPEWRGLGVKFDFAVQKKPFGNGDAILSAKPFLDQNPFLVCFSDDLLVARKPPLLTLVQLFEKTRAPIVALEPVPKNQVSQYGVVKAEKSIISKDLYQLIDVVEKPALEEAPSNLTIIGRYILTKDILDEIKKLYPHQRKEIGLAEALKNYARSGGRLFGWHFRGERFDGGSKIGILKAQTYFGLRHKELGPEFRKYIQGL